MLIAKENFIFHSRKIHPHGIFWLIQIRSFCINEARVHGKHSYFVFSFLGVLSQPFICRLNRQVNMGFFSCIFFF